MKNIIKTIYSLFFQPEKWYVFIESFILKIISISFFMLGYFLYLKWSFPYEIGFVIVFLLIMVVSVHCVINYHKEMKKIVSSLVLQTPAIKANIFFTNYCISTPIYIFIIPISIVFIFGVGGCSMYQNIKWNPSFIWGMIFFCFVVYTSIIGYLHYIAIMIYIFKLSKGNSNYTNLEKGIIEYIPIEIEWLQKLTKLYQKFRLSFFFLGSLYITAFSIFCWAPIFNTNRKSIFFIILWVIIIFAIVITSRMQYIKIKKIVSNLKKYYIKDLKKETNIFNNTSYNELVYYIMSYIKCYYENIIITSADYPISSKFNSIVSVFLSMFNIILAIITSLNDIIYFPSVLHNIF